MNVVECTNVTKVYGKTRALDEISFTIAQSKITGLIGRNGAGKTTLLKLIAGFLHETSGELRVFSEKPFNNLKVSANMIFIDDQMHFPTSLHLEDILQVASTFYENWDMDLANRLFNYFSFDHKQRHHNLSKGMKSTFNVIIGLAAHCPLTIFDEPTTGMDAAVRKDFYRALLKDYLEYPRTILLSSHLLNEMEELLEDVLLLKDGKECLHLPIEDLKEYAIGISGKSGYVQELIIEKEVLYRKEIGIDHAYVVVKSEGNIVQAAEERGLKVNSVTAEDICVYLTNKTMGGIDHVFNRD